MHSAPRVECRFGPSRRALFWRWGVHAAAAMAALVVPGWWRLAALAWVGAIAWSLRQPQPHGVLVLPGDGTRWLDSGSGAVLIEIAAGSLVTSSLIVLRYRDEHGRHGTLTLWPDSADAEALRQLRIGLCWARPPGQQSSGQPS